MIKLKVLRIAFIFLESFLQKTLQNCIQKNYDFKKLFDKINDLCKT